MINRNGGRNSSVKHGTINNLSQIIDQATHIVENQSITYDHRSIISSQLGHSSSKGYMSSLISDSLRKPRQSKLINNMSKDSLRKFDYQHVYPLNEKRFNMVTLPSIATKNKRVPNLVPNYSRQGLMEKQLEGLKKKKLMDETRERNYTLNYSQVHSRSPALAFRTKKHSEIANASANMLL